MLMLSPSGAFNRCKNLTTLSKLSKGSPLPMSTIFDTFSSPSCSASLFTQRTSASISPGRRFLTLPSSVDAQNAHPIAQPTCVDMQTVLPYLYCISTPSTMFPSSREKRYFLVPSLPTSFFRILAPPILIAPSLCTRADGIFDISHGAFPCEKPLKSCAALKDGCPNSAISILSSSVFISSNASKMILLKIMMPVLNSQCTPVLYVRSAHTRNEKAVYTVTPRQQLYKTLPSFNCLRRIYIIYCKFRML